MTLRAWVACMAVAGLVALGGCGSSKPAYCTDRNNLEASIKGLTRLSQVEVEESNDLSVKRSEISGLKSQFSKIRSDATALVNSAQSDFPSQINAIKTAMSELESAVAALPSSPSGGQIATVVGAASSFVSSVQLFAAATRSKCG